MGTLEPAAEQKQKEKQDSPPSPPPGEGAALSSLSPEKERTLTSPCCPRQGHFIDFLDDLGPDWDARGAALLQEGRHASLGGDSAHQNSSGGCRRVPTEMSTLRPWGSGG